MALKPYNEGFKPKHVAPAFGGNGSTDFPTDEVISRLDGEHTDQQDWKCIDTLTALRKLMVWIATCKARDRRAISFIGKRSIAALWVIDPQMFDNAPAHMVAKSFSISHMKFSQMTAEFSRAFKIRNRFQSHDWKSRKH